MNPPLLNAGTEALLQGYLEGTLTIEDSSRLLVALRLQPELVGVLLEGLRMDTLIREVVSQSTAVTSRATTPLVPQSASEERSRRREEANQDTFSRLKSASLPRRLRPLWNRPAVLAFAASVMLLIGLAARYFGPTMGEPVLAEVKGLDASIERGTEFIPAANGMMLQAADVLRLGTNASASIAFGPEKTRLELSVSTDLKLASLARGKRFVLASGKIEAAVARQRPFQSMVFVTPQAEARVLGTKFTVTAETNATRLEVTEGKVKFTRKSDDAAVKVSAGQYAIAATNAELAALPATGRIVREVWTNYPGAFMALMTSDETFSKHPNDWEYLTRFETPPNAATRSGERVRGYVHPPATGEYRFSIANTGSGEAFLFLSPDDKPEKRVHISETDTTTRSDGQPSPPPTPITLVAGRKYYIEALHESDTGKGHFTVRWQVPGREREVISGEFLSPYKVNPKEKKP